MNTDGSGEDKGSVAKVEERIISDKLDDQKDMREASGVASDRAKGQGSALHKIITISEEARQVLAMANFHDDLEASNCVAAIVEAVRYGLSDAMILDWVAAHCGVSRQKQSVREWGVQALTHLEINQQSQQKIGWRGQKKEERPT